MIGTENNNYNSESASSLLHGVGDDLVDSAIESLLSQNVFSKLVRDVSKAAPGRTLKISDPYVITKVSF